ncbi:MAG: hypothetical protein AAF357_08190, partial [Verrucomicrobiota bacterium]
MVAPMNKARMREDLKFPGGCLWTGVRSKARRFLQRFSKEYSSPITKVGIIIGDPIEMKRPNSNGKVSKI